MSIRWLSVLVLSAALLGACSDDSSDKDAGTDAGPTAGKGGNGGTAGTGDESIKCGSKTCMKPALDVSGFDAGGMAFDPSLINQFVPSNACCTEGDNLCGIQSDVITGGQCVELDQEGKADDACPAYTNNLSIMGFSLPISLPGCCRPDNKCGLDVAMLGVGCVERTEVAKFAMMGASAGAGMFDAGGLDAGAPLESIGCVYTPPTGGDDAGSEDAGR